MQLERLRREEDEARELEEKLSKSVSSKDSVLSKIVDVYSLKSRQILDGVWMEKKSSSGYMTQKRYVWVDPEHCRLYWSKEAGKNSPRKKCIDLVTEVHSVKLNTVETGFCVHLFSRLFSCSIARLEYIRRF